MSLGKCPKCEKPVGSDVVLDFIEIHYHGKNLKGVSYLCPSCHSVLSIQIDPVVMALEVERTIANLERFVRSLR